MPRSAPHPCGKSGCPNLVHGRYCAPHQREADLAYTQARGTVAQRGYGAAWAAYSRSYRQQHPRCVACLARGVHTPTACVDHITPVSGPRDPLFWEPSNHQSLCLSCHSTKTVTEDRRGIGRRQRDG